MKNSIRTFVKSAFAGCLTLATIVFATTAFADGGGHVARSKPWQMWLQEPMSPSAVMVHDLNAMLLWLEAGIVVFVLALLIYVMVRFSEKSNPVPSKTAHHTTLEVVWTVVPILILAGVAFPSLKTLYYADSTPEAEMTLKVVGNQWYWSYVYPDSDDLEFDSIMLEDEELAEGQPRLLSVDYPAVVPVGTNIRLILTSNDVIHNWAIPSLAVKLDTTPGRVNETWMRVDEPGDYYGMCSELCGVNHGRMPIHVKAVSKEEYAVWTKAAQVEFSMNSDEKPLVLANAARLPDVATKGLSK